MPYNIAYWELQHVSENAQINGAFINGTAYTLGSPIILQQSNLQAIVDWFNSLGFGAIFYGSYFSDSITLISTIKIIAASNDTIDSSLVNSVFGETNQSEFNTDFTFTESTSNASEILENLSCVMQHYETSFCKSCKCDDICRNRKSSNILKATLLMRELELPFDSEVEFQNKLEEYSTVIKKLCQCS